MKCTLNKLFLVISVLSFGCQKEGASKKTTPRDRVAPTAKPSPTAPTPTPSTSTNVPSPSPSPSPAPATVSQADLKILTALRPTTYYTAMEKDISCKGRYGRTGPVYKGNEKTLVIDRTGRTIVTVCTRFYRVLLMEGSAILRDRGQGEFAVNYSGKVQGTHRFHLLEKCIYGEGVRPGLCLLPFHTLATDNKVHKIGEIIYIPKADGLVLPDGTIHEGFFIVRDTGGAFINKGEKRVDMFTGTEPDSDNVFLKAGFHHGKDFEAYKVNGASADLIRERLRDRFGDLY